MQTNIAPRLASMALAALLTSATLAGIDALAHTEHAASGLLAQTVQTVARPS